MTNETNNLLNIFGRLLERREFIGAVLHASQIDNHQMQNRGPARVLRLLKEHDKLTNSDIVETLDIRPSSVSALVSKLEEEGYLVRTPSENDGRVMLISLTDKGRDAIHEARDFKNDLSEKLFKSLSKDEQQQLAGLIDKLSDGLESQAKDWPDHDRYRAFFGHHHGPMGHHPMRGDFRGYGFFGGPRREEDK